MNHTQNNVVRPSFRERLKVLFVRDPKDDPVLDGLRGISSLLIIVFHSFYGAAYILRDPERIFQFLQSFHPALGFLFTTEKAVDIFFMVSAYLLSTSLIAEYRRTGRIHLKKFYTRRAFRILPVFYFALFLYSLESTKRSLPKLPYNLLFIDNFWGKQIIPVGWSLSIEMQFYAVLPFLVLFLMKVQKPLVSLFGLLLLAFIVQAVVLGLKPEIYTSSFSDFLTGKVNPSIFMVHYYYPTHVRFGPLVIGLIWGWLKASPKKDSTLTNNLVSPAILTGTFYAGVFLVVICAYFPVYNPHSPLNLLISDAGRFWVMLLHRNVFCIGLLMVLYVLHVRSYRFLGTKALNQFLSFKLWRPFSQAVFPIYLFHFPMIALAGIFVLGSTKIANVRLLSLAEVGLVFLIAAVLSLFLGSLLHVYLEKPMIEKGNSIAKNFAP